MAGLIFGPAHQLSVVAENQVMPLAQHANDLGARAADPSRYIPQVVGSGLTPEKVVV